MHRSELYILVPDAFCTAVVAQRSGAANALATLRSIVGYLRDNYAKPSFDLRATLHAANLDARLAVTRTRKQVIAVFSFMFNINAQCSRLQAIFLALCFIVFGSPLPVCMKAINRMEQLLNNLANLLDALRLAANMKQQRATGISIGMKFVAFLAVLLPRADY